MTALHLATRAALAFGFCASSFAFAASDAAQPESDWRFDGQVTNVTQRHPAFRAPYSGANSMPPQEPTRETTDITLFIGRRFGRDTELWLNPEIDQGFGLGNTLGAAGFPSGEAYKVGANRPYFRLPRAFLRHTVDLGGEPQSVDAQQNQFAIASTADRLVVTAGKFSVVDVVDANTYAHDPRADFMNWSIVESGAFDYAADPWGYTFGAAAEWTHGAWTWRGGAFQMSAVPNGKVTGLHPQRHMLVGEVEHRHEWNGHPGKLRVLAFANHAGMARYRDALDAAQGTGDVPDVAAVRRVQSRAGVALNAEQEVASNVGVFARASANDGRKEAYEFTEINRSLAAGVSIQGTAWHRGEDTVGVGGAVNRLSHAARDYFAAGGLGILIGDGALRYADERIVEIYYAARVAKAITVTADIQRIANPAYNADRGPVKVWGLRVHAEF